MLLRVAVPNVGLCRLSVPVVRRQLYAVRLCVRGRGCLDRADSVPLLLFYLCYLAGTCTTSTRRRAWRSRSSTGG